jgi:hypothetical protein
MKRQKTGGRKKGTPNRRTLELRQLLDELKFDPTKALIRELKKPNAAPVTEQLVPETVETKPGKTVTKLVKKWLPDPNRAFNPDRAKLLERLHEFLYPRRKPQDVPAAPPAPSEAEQDLSEVSTEELMKAAGGRPQ